MEGFCNYEVMDTRLGKYNWSETVVGQSLDIPCFYNELLHKEGNYTRMCASRSAWKDVDSMSCISEVTYRLESITNVSLLISDILWHNHTSPLDLAVKV